MQHVPPQRWSIGVLVAGVGGAAAALAIEPLTLLATRAGVHHAAGTVIGANVLYPAAVIAAGAYFPRARMVPLFVLAALLAFMLARSAVRDWHFWAWSPAFVATSLHPVIVVGGIVAGGLAAGATALLRPWRVVGLPDEPSRCRACGYCLAGVESAQCPECGATRNHDPPGRT